MSLLAVLGHADDIKVGFSGPLFMDIGARMAAGMQFAFDNVNAAGGLYSRNITLVALNDDYNTSITSSNVRALLDDDNVIFLAGVVGSDVVPLITPLIVERGVPYVGPVTGIPQTRSPFHDVFVNVRASYADEVVGISRVLVELLLVQRVACLYQADDFGLSGYQALVDSLAIVGLSLVAAGTYAHGTTDVAGAVEAIAGAQLQAQAVVMVAMEDATVEFIQLFRLDHRTNPNCSFVIISSGAGPTFTVQLPREHWHDLYATQVVPVPGDPNWLIAQQFEAAYGATGNVPEPTAFEGYVVGRFITQVISGIGHSNFTRAMFLDEVYNTRLYVVEDMLLGLYSRRYPHCEFAVCDCNAGLRDVFLATFDPGTGARLPSYSMRYPVVQCTPPTSDILPPVLFGQLIPSDNGVWYAIALEFAVGVQAAFYDANANGGLAGRNFTLLQRPYSGAYSGPLDDLSNRYPLVALVGCIVPNSSAMVSPVPTVATWDSLELAQERTYHKTDLRVQPSTLLELMALTQFAVERQCALHLRAPSPSGQALLAAMVRSAENFQVEPLSSQLYGNSSDVLAGVTSGCVMVVGTDIGLGVLTSLAARPQVHLLLPSTPAIYLLATAGGDVNQTTLNRVHYPTILTGSWTNNPTAASENASEPFAYGYVVGHAIVEALQHSPNGTGRYTTPSDLVGAWYAASVMSSGDVTLGPYYDAVCTTSDSTDCECNQGVRTLAIRTAVSPVVETTYTSPFCFVQYRDLNQSPFAIIAPVVAVSGVVILCIVVLSAIILTRNLRNNFTAPKDQNKPFCIIFTDIQSSTYLWATIPEDMALALGMHHTLIRKLIAKHKCYEVKTIGDSFMCAVRTPEQALAFALGLQRVFFEHDWGTWAINSVYQKSMETDHPGMVSPVCWNGLRVRVGIHFGQGEIRLDAVSKGYDYYGTVVNTAARIESVAHGGQTVVSQAVFKELSSGRFPDSVWSDLGSHHLRGLTEPVHLHQVLPAGPLATRQFPPLRLDREDTKAEDLEHDDDDPVVPQRSLRTDNIDSASGTSAEENLRWIDNHTLVQRGVITADALRYHHRIAVATVSTLISIQSKRLRETALAALCERLHVRFWGSEGRDLQRTLQGLVRRVLPATVTACQGAKTLRAGERCDRLPSEVARGALAADPSLRPHVMDVPEEAASCSQGDCEV